MTNYFVAVGDSFELPANVKATLVNVGTGSPEGVLSAGPGVFYIRTDAGTRTNACIRPISSTVAASTGWAATGGTISVGSGYLRNTLSVTTGTRKLGSSSSNVYAVSPSTTYSFRAQARASVATMSVQFSVRFYTSGGVQTGGTNLGTVVAITDTSGWTDVPAVTVAAPSDAAFTWFDIQVTSGSTNAVSDTLDVRRMMFEASNSVGSYFDGATSSGGGTTYAWTGTANASTSTAVYSVRPALYVKTGTGNTGWLSTAPAGGISVGSDATDPATTQALVNQLRAVLITAGIAS